MVHGYRCRSFPRGKKLFELLYGFSPRLFKEEVAINRNKTGRRRSVELLVLQVVRTTRAIRAQKSKENVIRCMTTFYTSGSVSVANGKAVDSSVKCPAFKPRFYGPCKVVESKHTIYKISSSITPYSRTEINARILRKYHERPSYLQLP